MRPRAVAAARHQRPDPALQPEEALALVMRAKRKSARVQQVAAQLHAWSTG
ncbi:hypothetical protein [Streptomyces sp. NPDC048825]|uniref:hypothetical protein n=1 Tax=Streptomyces sp. NPDC048825 TaxID=3365592 RepID=UPI003717C7EA